MILCVRMTAPHQKNPCQNSKKEAFRPTRARIVRACTPGKKLREKKHCTISFTLHSFSPSHSLSASLSLLISLSHLSLSSPLFSPPHAGPQWAIWLEQRGSTKYKYTYKYGEEYRESKTFEYSYQHLCATPKVCTICMIILLWYVMLYFFALCVWM